MAIADQVPVASRFGAKSTAEEVLADVDVTGRAAIVTGGYSGLGLETVRALAGHGARVIVPVRNEEKARSTLEGLKGDVRTLRMDLADIGSVRRFGQTISAEMDRLDLLINNAGIMACPEARTSQGWEMQFAVNHIGHFALTAALMPLLTATEGSRVVELSSGAHKRSDIRWDDIHFAGGAYEKWSAYGQSKTANALFANALSRRLSNSGGLAFSLHPGGILTPLQRHLPKEEMMALGWIDENGELAPAVRDAFKTPEQGSSTTIWAATSALLEGKTGVYCEDCNVAAPATGGYVGVASYACDDEAAERLWTLTESMLAEA